MAKVRGYTLQVGKIVAHVTSTRPLEPETVKALAELIKAAHNHANKEVSNG